MRCKAVILLLIVSCTFAGGCQAVMWGVVSVARFALRMPPPEREEKETEKWDGVDQED